jgi:hypothetical protein
MDDQRYSISSPGCNILKEVVSCLHVGQLAIFVTHFSQNMCFPQEGDRGSLATVLHTAQKKNSTNSFGDKNKSNSKSHGSCVGGSDGVSIIKYS